MSVEESKSYQLTRLHALGRQQMWSVVYRLHVDKAEGRNDARWWGCAMLKQPQPPAHLHLQYLTFCLEITFL